MLFLQGKKAEVVSLDSSDCWNFGVSYEVLIFEVNMCIHSYVYVHPYIKPFLWMQFSEMHFSMAEKWDHDKAFNLLCSVVYSCPLPSPFWEAVKRKLFAGLGLDLTLFPSLLLYSSLQGIILHFLNCRERSWCWQWLYWEMGFNEVQSTYCTGTLAFASWMIASCHIDIDDFVTKGTDLFAPMHFIVRLCFKKVLSCCFISTCIFLFENIATWK